MNAIKIVAIAAIALSIDQAAAQTEGDAYLRALAEAFKICSEEGAASAACSVANRMAIATIRVRRTEEVAASRCPPKHSSVLDTLERLRAAQQQQQASTARPNARPPQGGGAPQGSSDLTAAERDALADRICECWSIDAGAPGLESVGVELRAEVDAGGTVRAVRPNGTIPTEPRARMVYEAARRALLSPRCNPLPQPVAQAV
jgi:hypothetical protein